MSVADNAFAVILGGGAGTRLWPSSRRARPKQLLSLGAPESLIAAAVRRGAALVGPERTLVVTAADQEADVRAAVPALPAANVVIEPVARNTAAAIGLGAVDAARRAGPDAVMAVLPADPPHRRRGGVRARCCALAIAEARRRHRDDRHHADARRRPASATSSWAAAAARRATPCTTWAASSRSRTARRPSATSRRALPVERGHVLPDRAAACSTRRARHLPGAGARSCDARVAAGDPDAGHARRLRRRCRRSRSTTA